MLYVTDRNSRGVALFIMSFIWRAGDTYGKGDDSNLSVKQDYGPQIAATFMFVLGAIYLRLMIHDVVRMGLDSGKMHRMEGPSLSHRMSQGPNLMPMKPSRVKFQTEFCMIWEV
jgi:hypothetical protein